MKRCRSMMKIFLVIMTLVLTCCSSSSDSTIIVLVRINETEDIAWITKGEKEYVIDISGHPTAKISRPSLRVIDPTTMEQTNYPGGWVFPDELVTFTITNLSIEESETVTVNVIYPTSYTGADRYYKTTADGFSQYSDVVIDGNSVTLTLTDNGAGDSDTVNGQITDPGGPAIFQSTGWIVGGAPGDGYGLILNTTDGGQTWVRQGAPGMIPDVPLSDIRAIDANNAWAVGQVDHDYGVILRTRDGGTTWERQGTEALLSGIDLYGIGVLDEDTAWVVGKSGTIVYTSDGGDTWALQAGNGELTSTFLYVVAVLDSQNVWIVGDQDGGYATIFRTSNGGTDWIRQGTQESIQTHTFIDISAVDQSTAWAVGQESTILSTVNGTDWTLQNFEEGESSPHFNGVCALNTQQAWVAVDFDTMAHTTDGGTTWIQEETPDNIRKGFFLISTTAFDMNTVWMVGETEDPWSPSVQQGIIIHSKDAGATWEEQTFPVNVRLRRISFVGASK